MFNLKSFWGKYPANFLKKFSYENSNFQKYLPLLYFFKSKLEFFIDSIQALGKVFSNRAKCLETGPIF